ncbi:MAG: hypothetical protein WBX25_28490 [Rhodomicrobium sp.]
MPSNRTNFVAIKHELTAARIATQRASAHAQRSEDVHLAERLRELADRLGYELDYVEARLATMP